MKSRSNRAKILIIGHGRHGKDTAAEFMQDHGGLSFVSSSEFAAEKAVFPLMADLYPDWRACFEDRANHRGLWHHAIAAYNLRPGPMLAEQILEAHDIYVGMRKRYEFARSRDLFDVVVWVDRSEHLPPEDTFSNELTADDADVVIDNNGDLEQLEANVLAFLSEQLPEFFADCDPVVGSPGMREFLKCDADGCDHAEVVGRVTEDHVGAPCPLCGASLLTEVDWRGWQFVQALSSIVEGAVSALPDADVACHEDGGPMVINYHNGALMIVDDLVFPE
jgi:hypothetical protein